MTRKTAELPPAWASPHARVDPSAVLGPGTRVWADATVRAGAVLGRECIVGERAFIDEGVHVGDRGKIQNAALVYGPAVVEDGVFIGPGAILTNDRHPRAVGPEGALLRAGDWTPQGVVLRSGASIGAGAVIVAGVEVGPWAMVAAGAVVTKDVRPHELVAGIPARRIGWVGRSGCGLVEEAPGTLRDPRTGERYRLSGDRVEGLV